VTPFSHLLLLLLLLLLLYQWSLQVMLFLLSFPLLCQRKNPHAFCEMNVHRPRRAAVTA
jgi:hypothetical protein